VRVLWRAVITSHEATVTVHQLEWRAVMLQCHFLDLVLSKHFVVYESVRSIHLSFIPNHAPYVEQGFNALQNIPNPCWFVVGAIR